MKFKCKDCNHETNNEDSDDLACPECGGELLKTEKQQKMKLETKELRDVEIFEAGNWKGNEYTEADLDEMVKHQKEGVIDAYISLIPFFILFLLVYFIPFAESLSHHFRHMVATSTT